MLFRSGLATRQIPERYREKLCVLSARFEEGYSDVTDVTGAVLEGGKGLTPQMRSVGRAPDPSGERVNYLLAGVEEA